jgi:excisionase family DNA binding protein
MDNPNRLISTEELAAYLEIPLATIYQWCHKGMAPPAVRLGKHLRFRWEDVQNWLEERATRR